MNTITTKDVTQIHFKDPEKRHRWLQLIEGNLDVNGTQLSPGDGAAIECEAELQLHSSNGAHFLFFDLN